jgi:DNA sulfur modification protein DndC
LLKTGLNSKPPWGGSYREIVNLYKNATGGECPFVMSSDDAPSCGTSSARFGCWTCTVVDKDNSLESLITSGHQHLEPLANFRKRLKEGNAYGRESTVEYGWLEPSNPNPKQMR